VLHTLRDEITSATTARARALANMLLVSRGLPRHAFSWQQSYSALVAAAARRRPQPTPQAAETSLEASAARVPAAVVASSMATRSTRESIINWAARNARTGGKRESSHTGEPQCIWPRSLVACHTWMMLLLYDHLPSNCLTRQRTLFVLYQRHENL
jgi:hypothetical protein